MHSLNNDELVTVHGGIDWSAAHEKGKVWAGATAPVGGVIGGALWGAAAGWPGVFFGGITGTKAGLGLGYVAGWGKGVYDTWDQ